jgi:hypothetical protein
LYVAWVLLADLFDGWGSLVHRFNRLRQYNIRTIFNIVTVFAVTFSILRWVGVADTLEMNLLVGSACLVWAVGIVCMVRFAVAEFFEVNLKRTKLRPVRDADMLREAMTTDLQTEEGIPATATARVDPNAVPDLMPNVVGASCGETSRRLSTGKVREHFRVFLTRDPKGSKGSGFGRF